MSGKYDRKDSFYERAKEEGYRSRAAYKLLELQKKLSLIPSGSTVVDLGAWPGGWTQVAAKIVGEKGKVVAVDLVPLDPMPEHPNVVLLEGDVRSETTLKAIQDACGQKTVDAVISDMSPKLSGIPEVDRIGAVGLNELALFVAEVLLSDKGVLIFKTFKCNEADIFIRELRKKFHKVQREELESTRKTSNEYYVVAKGLKR